MQPAKLDKRVVGLEVRQAKISSCTIAEDEAKETSVELAEFGGFQRGPPGNGEVGGRTRAGGGCPGKHGHLRAESECFPVQVRGPMLARRR